MTIHMQVMAVTETESREHEVQTVVTCSRRAIPQSADIPQACLSHITSPVARAHLVEVLYSTSSLSRVV